MGSSNPADGQTTARLAMDAMAAELHNMHNRHQLVLRRAEELSAQIGIFEKRRQYAQAALEDSRRIAEEIDSGARRRIDVVMKSAHEAIAAHQAEIEHLEIEIAELAQELGQRVPGDKCRPPALAPDVALTGSPGLEGTGSERPGPYRRYDEQRHRPPSPAGRICELEMEAGKEMPGVLTPPAARAGTEKEDDGPAGLPRSAEGAAGDSSPVLESVSPGSDAAPPAPAAGQGTDAGAPREFSLREPQPEVLPMGVEAAAAGPKPGDVQPRGRETAAPSTQAAGETEPVLNLAPMSVVTSERTELPYGSLAEPREVIEEREDSSIMHLDVFMDTRHKHSEEPWNQEMHRHRWHVKVQVEVPKTQEVAYSQLLSAVNTALLRYDNVLLNDIFPFDHIDPSHENVAGYFFNCLEDIVGLKGLRLVEVGLWEKQNLLLQVHSRSAEVDALLRGEEVLNQMREGIYREPSADGESSFRRMLGMMFKNRN